MLRSVLISVLLVFSAPALAIHKCESGGRIAYSQEPCASDAKDTSAELRVKIDNSAAGSDAALARAQTAREKNEIARLEKTRHKREAIHERERQRADRAYAAKEKKCQSLALKKKWATEDTMKTNVKTAAKARGTIRRLDEKIELECG